MFTHLTLLPLYEFIKLWNATEHLKFGWYPFSDFSLNDWMETNGYPLLAVLPLYAASQLLHDLDIIQYLGELSCNRKSVPFYPSKLGWNNGKI